MTTTFTAAAPAATVRRPATRLRRLRHRGGHRCPGFGLVAGAPYYQCAHGFSIPIVDAVAQLRAGEGR